MIIMPYNNDGCSSCLFYDFETTGLNPFHDNIIEYSFLGVAWGSISSLIHPKKMLSEKITKITNIKNINYFKSDKAPLAFGESGNLERLFFRRYEFINRYQEIDNKNKQKFIIGESGLFLNKSEWCNLIYLNGLKPCQKN